MWAAHSPCLRSARQALPPAGEDARRLRARAWPDYTPIMKIARLACLFALLASALMLAACGNKGDLVRPGDDKAAVAN